LIGIGAAFALVAGSGFALASSGGGPHAGTSGGPATSSTVYRGCVEGSSRTLAHVYTRSNPPTCPSGSFPATWNQQGPAGEATGYAASGGSVSLPDTFTTVDTLTLPSGDFLLNAKVTVYSDPLSGEDYIPCELVDGSGTEVDISYTSLNPGSLGGDQTTVSNMGITTAGGTIQLECFAGQSTATAVDSVITALPLASVSGTTNHLRHQSVLRNGTPAVPRRG
jgi:hypothetical protein